MKYLLKTTEYYSVDTVEEVEALHESLKTDKWADLISFSYKTKYRGPKDDREEYQLVTATKMFTDEKMPDRRIRTVYEVDA